MQITNFKPKYEIYTSNQKYEYNIQTLWTCVIYSTFTPKLRNTNSQTLRLCVVGLLTFTGEKTTTYKRSGPVFRVQHFHTKTINTNSPAAFVLYITVTLKYEIQTLRHCVIQYFHTNNTQNTNFTPKLRFIQTLPGSVWYRTRLHAKNMI